MQPSQSAGYDYLIIIRNMKNLGFEPNDQSARDRAALAALKNQCDTPQIVGESVVNSEGGLFGNPTRRYEVKVRC